MDGLVLAATKRPCLRPEPVGVTQAMTAMPAVYIVGAARTPIGSFQGALSTVSAPDLGGIAIRAAVERSNISPSRVDEVIMGNVLTAGLGQNPARQASITGGLGDAVPAHTTGMVCGAGLKAVALGLQAIKAGDSNVVVCGGQENMSAAPHTMNMRKGVKFGDASMKDTMLGDALTDAFFNIHMGITAENVAKSHGITRQLQDEFALKSQHKAASAQLLGKFEKEITAVTIKNRRGDVTVDQDEYIRMDASSASIAKLSPAFIKVDGTVTAANASGLNDGAAAVVLASEDIVLAEKLKPLAQIVSWAQVGIDPQVMGLGPVGAITQALKKAGWTKEEVDLFELNEAFASQSLACLKDLNLDHDKVNVWGGAIALGHPVGCSGTRILVTLLHAMEARNASKGVAALCIGGGMGIAMCISRLE